MSSSAWAVLTGLFLIAISVPLMWLYMSIAKRMFAYEGKEMKKQRVDSGDYNVQIPEDSLPEPTPDRTKLIVGLYCALLNQDTANPHLLDTLNGQQERLDLIKVRLTPLFDEIDSQAIRIAELENK